MNCYRCGIDLHHYHCQITHGGYVVVEENVRGGSFGCSSEVVVVVDFDSGVVVVFVVAAMVVVVLVVVADSGLGMASFGTERHLRLQVVEVGHFGHSDVDHLDFDHLDHLDYGAVVASFVVFGVPVVLYTLPHAQSIDILLVVVAAADVVAEIVDADDVVVIGDIVVVAVVDHVVSNLHRKRHC